MSLNIRRARPGEAGLVLSFVRELAEYEKLLHEMEASEADIDAALFGANPPLFCEIAEWDGIPAGFGRLDFMQQLFVVGEFADEGEDEARFAGARAADVERHQSLTPQLPP